MAELLTRLKVRLDITGTAEDALLKECLDSAIWSYVELRYPYSSFTIDQQGEPIVERRYASWVLDAAVEFYNKIGAEGQSAHSENGVSRSYESANLSESLRIRITPVMGIVR